MSKQNRDTVSNLLRAGAGAFSAYQFYSGQGTKRAAGGSFTRTVTKKRQIVPEMTGQMVSRRYKRSGRIRRRSGNTLWKNIVGGGDELIMRWQQSSQTYIGPGKIGIRWGSTQSGTYLLPMHFMSLTNAGIGNSSNASLAQSKGCRLNGLFQYAYDSNAGIEGYAWGNLPSQKYDGSLDPFGFWQIEKYDRSLLDLIDANFTWRRMFHKYSDIRLNLYACYDIPIRYHVQLVQFDAEVDPLASAGGGTVVSARSDTGQMLQDMVKPLLYNSVNTNPNKDWKRKVRIIKSVNVTLQPQSYSDQRAERLDAADGQTVGHTGGHIHELRWFIRHDRFRKYDWDHPANENSVNGNVGTWDRNFSLGPYCDVEPGKKVYLFITASAAMQDPTPENANPSWDPKISGSYDINVRNCFRLFK